MVDKETNDEVIIIKNYDELASEYKISSVNDRTVAELNEEYDENSKVVGVIFINSISYIDPTWQYKKIDEIIEIANTHQITVYKYPMSRLRSTDNQLINEWISVSIAGVSDPLSDNTGGYTIKYNDERFDDKSEYVERNNTVNEQHSEFLAVLSALKQIKNQSNIEGVHIYIAREDTINKLTGTKKISSSNIKNIYNKIKKIESQFKKISYETVSRVDNKETIDEAVNNYKSTQKERNVA